MKKKKPSSRPSSLETAKTLSSSLEKLLLKTAHKSLMQDGFDLDSLGLIRAKDPTGFQQLGSLIPLSSLDLF